MAKTELKTTEEFLNWAITKGLGYADTKMVLDVWTSRGHWEIDGSEEAADGLQISTVKGVRVFEIVKFNEETYEEISRTPVDPTRCKWVEEKFYSLKWNLSDHWRTPSISIPVEVGDMLAANWKQNEYHRFVGAKAFKNIVKLVTNDNRFSAKLADAKALAEKNTRNNNRDYLTKLTADYIRQLGNCMNVAGDEGSTAINALNNLIAKLEADKEA